MKIKILTLNLLLTLLFSVDAQSISEDRRIDWSKAGVEGGIPRVCNEEAIFDIMDYGGNGNANTDNYAAIQAAFSAAKSSSEPLTIIYFPAGEYLINSSVHVPSNTIIRGESSERTKLVFDLGGASSPCFETAIWKWGSYTAVESGMTKGSTSLTVTDPSTFIVGQWFEIEEDNNAELMYTSEDWNVSYAQYAKGQFARVTAINGNNITIDRPLYVNYDANQEIRARKGELAENIGFENFSITRPNTGDSYFFYLKNVCNTWLQGINGYRTNRAFVQTERAVNYEVRGCYFERSYDYGGGGHGYGVSVGYHSCDGLIENNVFNRLRHHMIISKGATGNVFGYNYSFDRVQGSDTNNLNDGWIPPDISIHGHWSYMNLFEGNVSQEIHSADFWGPSGPGTTFFRNRLVAAEGITVDDSSVDQNIVANELLLGGIDIDESVNGTFTHGNSLDGAVTWSNGVTQVLEDSYYLNEKPSWWDTGAWPFVGPEFEINSGTNPAKNRWDNNSKALTYDFDAVCNVTSASDVGSLDANLFPNPFVETLQISVPNAEKVNLEVYTADSQLIQSSDFTGNYTLGASFEKGIYFVKLSSSDGSSAVYKMIKN